MKEIISPNLLVTALDDGALLKILHRGAVEKTLRLGPNHIHALVRRKDGSIEDLGVSTNLLTNSGRDLWAAAFGHAAGVTGTATATTATSLTATAGQANDGCKGWRIYVPVTNLTTQPVYGNVSTNTTTAFTVDQWWTAADGLGTTPGNSAFICYAQCTPRFMAITADTGAAAAGDSTLAGEISGNGYSRAKATYAHTAATATYTMQVIYTITGGTSTTVHKMGLFTALSSGIMVFETVLNADAIVGNGDTLTVTDTLTLSGT